MKQEYLDDDIRLLALLPLINRTILSASRIREFGYTKTQLTIFAALTLRESLTMSQVSGYISSSKEQATRAVAPLVDEGLVERFVDPENRTHIHIRLTAKGNEFMEVCRARFKKNLHAQLDDTVTPDEKAELFSAIDSLLRILGKLN